jgi:hypothetical protein
VDGCRRPIGGAAGEPVFSRFVIVIDRIRVLDESGPVIEAIDVDDGAGTGSGFTNCADINAAAPANQKFGGARAKSVRFDERSISRPDLDPPARIAGRPRVMGAAE